MTKQEVIKQSYGEYWDKVKDLVNEHGFLPLEIWHEIIGYNGIHGIDMDNRNNIRPSQLAGIENNNGWVKIESDDDLPKEIDNNEFKLNYWTSNGFYNSEDYKRWKMHYSHLQITHYQIMPITKPLPPIY